MESIKEKTGKAFGTLKADFGYKNAMQAPKITKVTISSGVGSQKDKKKIELIADRLSKITGQKPVRKGAKISIAAQGGLGDSALLSYDPGIYSTINTGLTTPDLTAGGSSYGYKSGTSMATPHVSAAIALMIARNPALSPSQLKSVLIGSVSGFPSFPAAGGWGPYDCATLKNCGVGILNARLAVQNCILPYSAETAIAATKGGGITGGGCTIMSAAGNPDYSLLLLLVTILLYSGSRNLSVGKS